ncbi:MAG: Gfo/Idh/MocA family oxidoreductase [Clostridiales bacterium]|nr:Gfo/Idh/MocA family oxidoreductase [Clostridiales bacterium]
MKLGVVGNGLIVGWLFRDIKEIPEIRATALCVREKSREKGRELAEANGVSELYTDYEEFLAKGDFDTVYIGIANTMHYSYAKQALLAGKHVICEKPFTMTAAEARDLAELARERKLFLWEAFKIPYGPLYSAVKEHLPEIGEVRMVQCNYSQFSSRYERYQAGIITPAFDPECGGGSLYDLNLYNLHFVIGLFGKPDQVQYFANKGYNGIDTSGALILRFGPVLGVCTAAKDSGSPCYGFVQGTKGHIRIQGPVSAGTCAELVYNDKRTVRLAEDSADGSLTDELRIFEQKQREGDIQFCYQMLEHSLLVEDVLETAALQR